MLGFQWAAMKRRARNRTDCEVCAEWLDFQVFKAWAISQGYKEGISHFCRKGDAGNYEPSNVYLGTNQQNIEEAKAKHYSFISPEGEVVEVYNLRKFCKENGLSASNMCWLAKGKHKSCKGWKANIQ